VTYRVVIAGAVAPDAFDGLGTVVHDGPNTVVTGDDLRLILDRILALGLTFVGLRAT
jgi:hypothetical protein